MSAREFLFRLWHRLRCGHPYYSSAVGFATAHPCDRCQPGWFRPDYDWTSTCPHEGEDACPDGDDGCRCECHAVPDR